MIQLQDDIPPFGRNDHSIKIYIGCMGGGRAATTPFFFKSPLVIPNEAQRGEESQCVLRTHPFPVFHQLIPFPFF
jgi:hypothetical protein